MQTVKEIYTQTIRPLGEGQRLELAILILEDITHARTEERVLSSNGGGIREMFGTWSGGDPNGSDNEKIDADLARAYADNHEDED